MNKDVINVYWAVQINGDEQESPALTFEEPKSLFKTLSRSKHPDSTTQTLFSCPAVQDLFKNVYVVRSPADAEYDYRDKEIVNINNSIINLSQDVDPNIKGFGPMFVYQSFYLFFADEPVVARFTSPYFDKTLGDCSLIPGEFDIGKWFRAYPTQYQMWNESGKFKLNKNDPLFYIEFMTNKKINFIQFEMNKELSDYSNIAIESRYKFPFSRLADHYERFKQNKMRELILNAIDKQY
jgi:hypothetical protein